MVVVCVCVCPRLFTRRQKIRGFTATRTRHSLLLATVERASRDGAEGRDAKPRHRLGLPTKAMLTLELDDSHVVVVDEANSGSRALAFAGRAFREPLGRVDAEFSAHASCKALRVVRRRW